MSSSFLMMATHKRGNIFEYVEIFVGMELYQVVKGFITTNDVFMEMCEEMSTDVTGCAMFAQGVKHEAHEERMLNEEIPHLADFWRNPQSLGRRAFDEVSKRRKRLVSILINEGVFKTLADSNANWQIREPKE